MQNYLDTFCVSHVKYIYIYVCVCVCVCVCEKKFHSKISVSLCQSTITRYNNITQMFTIKYKDQMDLYIELNHVVHSKEHFTQV